MIFGGYKKAADKNAEPEWVDLETSYIVASIEEIDELIKFLQYVKEDHILQRDFYKLPQTHNHYMYWQKDKRFLGDSDLVIHSFFDETKN